MSGPDYFGFAARGVVGRLLEGLPGAHRCKRYNFIGNRTNTRKSKGSKGSTSGSCSNGSGSVNDSCAIDVEDTHETASSTAVASSSSKGDAEPRHRQGKRKKSAVKSKEHGSKDTNGNSDNGGDVLSSLVQVQTANKRRRIGAMSPSSGAACAALDESMESVQSDQAPPSLSESLSESKAEATGAVRKNEEGDEDCIIVEQNSAPQGKGKRCADGKRKRKGDERKSDGRGKEKGTRGKAMDENESRNQQRKKRKRQAVLGCDKGGSMKLKKGRKSLLGWFKRTPKTS